MDKITAYNDIEKRLRECNDITRTGEGKFVVGIICQRIKDAMGLLRADKVRVYIPSESKSGEYVKCKTATHQQIAIDWFRDKEHYVWADLLDMEPTWITWLMRTKGAVEI